MASLSPFAGASPRSYQSMSPPRSSVSYSTSQHLHPSALQLSPPLQSHSHAESISQSSFPLVEQFAFLYSLATLRDREERHYEREAAKLSSLKERAVKCQELTDSMVDILDSFDKKLATLESSMLPVHRGTEGLTLAQKNLDAVLVKNEEIVRHLTVAKENDSDNVVDSDSPLSLSSSRSIQVAPHSFLSWLLSINDALTFFTHHSNYKDSANYVKKLREIQRLALTACDSEFTRLLSSHSRPLDPVKLAWPFSASANGMEVIDRSIVRILSEIASSMSVCGQPAYRAIIVRERSPIVRQSIKNCIKNENYNPIKVANSSTSSPRNASDYYVRGSHFLIYHFAFLIFVFQLENDFLVQLLANTNEAIENNRDEFNKLLSDICFESLNYFNEKENEKFRAFLKVEPRIENRILSLLDAYECSNQALKASRMWLTQPLFAECLNYQSSLTHTLRKQVADYLSYLQLYDEANPSQALSQLNLAAISVTASYSSKSRKRDDGNVYVLTVEVMTLSRQLLEYRPVVAASFAQSQTIVDYHYQAVVDKFEREKRDKDRQLASDSEDYDKKKAKNKLTFLLIEQQAHREREREKRTKKSQFLKSVSTYKTFDLLLALILVSLEINLENRVKSLKSAVLASLFALNNYHYVRKYLLSYSFAPPSELIDYYDCCINTALADYRASSWNGILVALPLEQECQALVHAFVSSDSNAQTKAKKSIKGIFSSFNALMDEQSQAQRYWAVNDGAMKQRIKVENAELLLPRYRIVYERLSVIPFTTKPGHYCKYTPHVLEQTLARFFEETD